MDKIFNYLDDKLINLKEFFGIDPFLMVGIIAMVIYLIVQGKKDINLFSERSSDDDKVKMTSYLKYAVLVLLIILSARIVFRKNEIYEYVNDEFDSLIESLGTDPFLLVALIVIVLFLIVWGNKLYLISKKNTTGYEKALKHYIISAVIAVFILLILSVIYILEWLLNL